MHGKTSFEVKEKSHIVCLIYRKTVLRSMKEAMLLDSYMEKSVLESRKKSKTLDSGMEKLS